MVVFKKFGILLMIFCIFDSYSFIACAATRNKSGKPVVSPPIARTLSVGGTFPPMVDLPKVLPHELKNTSLEDPIVFFPQPFAYPGYPVVVYL